MGETLTTWTPSCNGAVRVELSGQRTTSDSGALLLREALDNSGVIEALEDNLVDLRNPLRVRHSPATRAEEADPDKRCHQSVPPDRSISTLVNEAGYTSVSPLFHRWCCNCLNSVENFSAINEIGGFPAGIMLLPLTP